MAPPAEAVIATAASCSGSGGGSTLGVGSMMPPADERAEEGAESVPGPAPALECGFGLRTLPCGDASGEERDCLSRGCARAYSIADGLTIGSPREHGMVAHRRARGPREEERVGPSNFERKGGTLRPVLKNKPTSKECMHIRGASAPADGRPRPPVPFARGARYTFVSSLHVDGGFQNSNAYPRPCGVVAGRARRLKLACLPVITLPATENR